jgi:hypothetical protein
MKKTQDDDIDSVRSVEVKSLLFLLAPKIPESLQVPQKCLDVENVNKTLTTINPGTQNQSAS